MGVSPPSVTNPTAAGIVRLLTVFTWLWIAAGGLTLDAAVTHVIEAETEVDVTRRFFAGTPFASSVRVRADVDAAVTTFAINARVRF